MDSIRVAVAQVASVFADKDACIAKAVRVIRDAGREGADLVLLPEAMIPGLPAWLHLRRLCRQSQASRTAGLRALLESVYES